MQCTLASVPSSIMRPRGGRFHRSVRQKGRAGAVSGVVDKIPGIPCKASPERAALDLKRIRLFWPDTCLFWA